MRRLSTTIMVATSATLLNNNNTDVDDLNNFFDQFDDLQDEPAELAILDDANLNDIFPSIWTDEPSHKLTHLDLALQNELIRDAGMVSGDGKMCVADCGRVRSERVSPVSVLGKKGVYTDLAKEMLTVVPVECRARTKRPRQNVCAGDGDSSQQLVPVGWTWSASVDDIQRTAGKRRRVANKYKPYTPNVMDESQNSNPNSGLFEVGIERKCTHCEITKTPQWRLGPLGPKTLCNACGVRYKSGRLFPEYRPAASPTFSPSKHSNSHRKIIEMRKKSGKSSPATIAVNASEGAETHLVPVVVEQIGARNQLVPVAVEQIDGTFSWL